MKYWVGQKICLGFSKRSYRKTQTNFLASTILPAEIVYSKIKIGLFRASLVAQWLRIRLPMQGTRVRALVQEDPTCFRATKLVHHNY